MEFFLFLIEFSSCFCIAISKHKKIITMVISFIIVSCICLLIGLYALYLVQKVHSNLDHFEVDPFDKAHGRIIILLVLVFCVLIVAFGSIVTVSCCISLYDEPKVLHIDGILVSVFLQPCIIYWLNKRFLRPLKLHMREN